MTIDERNRIERLTAERTQLAAKILEILDGIDREELDDPPGWWETSTGAAFGAEKLRQVLAVVTGESADA